MVYIIIVRISYQSTYSAQTGFPYNKNHINFFMYFANPFTADQQPQGQNLNGQLCTQSQIINTLNSSIEDLLSKILKVKEDYEHEDHQNYTQFHFNILKENTAQVNHEAQKGFQRNSTKNDDKSTNGSSHFSTHRIEQSLQNRPLSNRYYPFPLISTPAHSQSCGNSLSNLNRPVSSKLIIQQVNKEPLLKITKIQSLFDSPSIKEVAESQVFLQDPVEGTYEILEHATRQVKETIISNDMLASVSLLDNISLSDFELGSQVGSGKFGEVYICKHKVTGMIFALKKIFKSTIRQYKMQSQLCLQLKILYMLNHPNIIKLYAHFCDEYHIFLLMEYVEGGQLLSRMKSNQKYVSRVVDQLINAIDYIHNRGIVHRDIKPENIVMAFDNTAKLCDFGWAGLFDYKNMKTTFCGTLDYVSPEMKDKGIYTSKVDLWSIGVLTYELLTGSAPFKDEINDWKKKGARRSVAWDWHITYPSDVSGLSQSFMRNLLRQNPDERASLRFCKSHFFIRKHKEHQSQINIQIYI